MLEEIMEKPEVKAGCFVLGLVAGSIATSLKIYHGSTVDPKGGFETEESIPYDGDIQGYDKKKYVKACNASAVVEIPAAVAGAVIAGMPAETGAFAAGYYLPHLIALRKKSWGKKDWVE